MTNLQDIDDGPPVREAPPAVAAPALHRRVDRDLAMLAGLDLADLGRLLHEAINVDGANPSTPDGFPSSTAGAPNTGRGVRLADPDGEVSWTSVESVGNVLAVGSADGVPTRRRPVDEYHTKVAATVDCVANAAQFVRLAVSKLAELDQLRAGAGLGAGDPGCWAMERIGAWEEVHATVVIDGEPRRLGNWAYRFHRDHGRLPSLAECHARSEGRKVMVKAGAR